MATRKRAKDSLERETTSTVATSTVTVSTPVKVQKPIKHNKKFPVVKTSRSKMIEMIKASKGRFFTSTHIDKEGNPRTMNATKSSKSQPTELGYLTVYSTQDKGLRNINPQTITDLSINGTHYTSNKK